MPLSLIANAASEPKGPRDIREARVTGSGPDRFPFCVWKQASHEAAAGIGAGIAGVDALRRELS
jgi:hypothetical protein